MYKIEFSSKVHKELKKIDKTDLAFIKKSLKEFIDNFSDEYEAELIKTGKIKYLKGEYSGFFRLRLRTYRVIYEKINDKLIIYVLRVSHRKSVYQ